MNPTSIPISRRLLQSADLNNFDAAPGTSLSAAIDPVFQPSNATTAPRPFNPNLPFGSSMVLTLLVLLTALFFLAFFSVYIRRLSSSASEDTGTPSSASRNRTPPPNQKGGLDSSAVNSLPLVAYGKAAKHPMIDDCTICLSELRERETVKLIPYCGHVFHPGCIDTWLSTHVTCPLCRSAELFERVEEEVCLDVTHDKNGRDMGERWRVEDGDAWRDERSGEVRRTCSGSSLVHKEAVLLQRSTSL
ncbi:RING-H2 finger protein ATL57 [Sesamum indicum]|uniref:RING-type E3 ubiquitin transferase n=1 Tax=Sesamum indicum TaxID=4182 RepID=A0A6I9U4P7_SESIN|nr:RING-H2 finger protein ATL57 [Sesamum indicum]